MRSLAKSLLITVAITLFICLALHLSGVFDGLYFRPNSRAYEPPTGGWRPHQEISFNSADSTKLVGWYFPAKDSARGTVVHYHGSDGNITYTARNLMWLVDAGNNLFAFDYRGYGRSEGSPSREGLVADSRAAYRLVRSMPDVDPDRIVLIGQSMGGQLAIQAALDDHPPRAVIAESTYGSYADHMFDKMGQLDFASIFKWPVWLIVSDALSANEVVDQLRCPLLLIHGTEDKGVRYHQSERLYQIASEPKQLWTVEGAEHLRIFRQSPFKDVYRPRLIDYLNQSLSDCFVVADKSPSQDPARLTVLSVSGPNTKNRLCLFHGRETRESCTSVEWDTSMSHPDPGVDRYEAGFWFINPRGKHLDCRHPHSPPFQNNPWHYHHRVNPRSEFRRSWRQRRQVCQLRIDCG